MVRGIARDVRLFSEKDWSKGALVSTQNNDAKLCSRAQISGQIVKKLKRLFDFLAVSCYKYNEGVFIPYY